MAYLLCCTHFLLDTEKNTKQNHVIKQILINDSKSKT